MDVSEEEVDNDYASGSQGSSIGENSVDSIVSEEHDDMSDDSEDWLDDVIAASNYMFDDSIDDEFDDLIAATIPSCSVFSTSNKQILGQFFTRRPDYKTTVFQTMKVLNNLTGVRM